MSRRGHIDRRGFLAVGVAVAATRAARAQQPGRTYRIAIVTRGGSGSDLSQTRPWRAWREELRRLGYVEGGTLVVERRTLDDPARLDELAREIVALAPDAIFTPAQNAAAALKAATATIPIVAVAFDPVGMGLAASLARPGGNVTGFTVDAGGNLVEKRIELLREVVPSLARMAYLTPRVWWDGRFGANARDTAMRMGIAIIGAPWDTPASEGEFRRAFAQMVGDRADSLYAIPALEHLEHRRLLAELAVAARLPGIFSFRENVEAGGMMAYVTDLADVFRRAAGIVDRILRGASPAEIPFDQPTRFELIVNVRTARALDIALPQTLLARADEVIE